ncbi:AraC family transcriptional regulator [Endozoicomonas ascidiicola]|uniref:AraC family transcriptional regulator n=1 Tax=Endozoicomonas ascidiicola TaxID=1698521 RepID=UPI00082F36F0|nr:AraC family transcriptional regulator [Endozoicomonas ascidiicola]
MDSYYIRSAVLASFVDLVSELGGDANRVLSQTNINSSLLKDPDASISHRDFYDLLVASIRETGCDHFGLLLGERNTLKNLGLLGLLLRSSPSFEVAIKEMIEHLGVHAKGINRELHQEGGVAWLTTSFESQGMTDLAPAIQASVATIWKICKLLSNNLWHPTTISFTYSKPKNAAFYERFFNAPITFDAEFNGVVFHAADLKLPLPDNDPLLHHEMKRQVDKLSDNETTHFIDQVRKLIRQNLESGICSIDSVVRFFPFQKRKFQDKLSQEGVSYQDLLDEIRYQKAEYYLLQSDMNLTQITELLCFTSVSVFSTAFKRRYGQSPSQWKKAMKLAR